MLQTLIHKPKKTADTGYSKPFATMVFKPDSWEITETVEKDLHFWLMVIGTEKHESRRIDNQLRGRSWRQGDPWASQFYVALDDEIMRKMWWDTIKSIAKRLLPAQELAQLELTQSQFTNSIARAQRQMEWHNFSIRKHLFDYDNVANKQRMKVYQKRDEILHRTSDDAPWVMKQVLEIIHHVATSIVHQWHHSKQPIRELDETVNQLFGKNRERNQSIDSNTEKITSRLSESLIHDRELKTHEMDPAKLVQIIRYLYLQTIDKYWIEHIDTMYHLREKVGLYGYAQQDPLVVYKQEAHKLYDQLWIAIHTEFVSDLYKVDLSHFQWTSTQLIHDVQTNADAFDDTQIGNMDREILWTWTHSWNKPQQLIVPSIVPWRDNTDNGVEIIDLSTLKKSPLIIPDGKKKIGANEQCPCGSWKKYKKCHGA